MSVIDKIGDALHLSGYSQSKKLARDFLNADLSREDYNKLLESGEGTLHGNFGRRAKVYQKQLSTNPDDYAYYDLELEKEVVSKELMGVSISRQMLLHLNSAGVTYDLQDVENESVRERMRDMIRVFAKTAEGNKKIISLGEPYDQSQSIVNTKMHQSAQNGIPYTPPEV